MKIGVLSLFHILINGKYPVPSKRKEMDLLSKNEENLIKAIAKVTGIQEKKIESYSQNNDVLNLLKRPKTIEPTKLQMEKINLLNEFLVNYSITKEFAHKKEISFNDTKEVGEYFKYLLGNKKDKEVFMCAFLDRNNQLIKIKKISEGTLSAALVFPREIVKEVLDTKCKSVVFCHNHPSGNTEPSNEDIALTKNLSNIISPLGVKVIDHIIVGDDFTSLKDMGVMSYSDDFEFSVSGNKKDYSIGKEYYKDHEDIFIDSLLNLANINPEKIYNCMKDIPQGDNTLYNKITNILNNPQISKDILSLNNREVEKLTTIRELLKSYNLVNTSYRAENKISGPLQMTDLFRDRIKDNGNEDIYLMLFNTKLVLLGIEKVTDRNKEKIILRPKDILTKTLDYDAASISLIHTNSLKDNEATELAIKISQNAYNILSPMQLRVLDYVFLNNSNYTSLKEKGLMPYTTVGSAEYNKVDIAIDNDYMQEIENEEFEMEF